jgi:hypothetical protein
MSRTVYIYLLAEHGRYIRLLDGTRTTGSLAYSTVHADIWFLDLLILDNQVNQYF